MKKAITRIELLVVIATITLLTGAFWPALGNARGNAHHNQCKNNLKKLVDGAILWAEDHNGWAIAGDWFKDPNKNEAESSLLPYITSKHDKCDTSHDKCDASQDNRDNIHRKCDTSLICPASRDVNFLHDYSDYPVNENNRRYTYAANGYITLNMAPFGEGSPGIQGSKDPRASGGLYGRDNTYWTVHGVTTMAAIRKPAETVFFTDHEYYVAISWTFNPTKPYSSFPAEYRYRTRWHNIKPGDDYGIGMIGWVDGHCSPEPSDFADKYKDPVSGKMIERWRYYFYDH